MKTLSLREKRLKTSRSSLFLGIFLIVVTIMAVWLSISESLPSQVMGMALAIVLVGTILMKFAAWLPKERFLYAWLLSLSKTQGNDGVIKAIMRFPIRLIAWLAKGRSALIAYIMRQIAWTLVLLIGTTFILYALTMLSGNPAVTLAGPRASEEIVDNILEVMGLNNPLYIHYPRNMWNWMRGDFGESLALVKGYPVWGLLKPRMLLSLSMGLPALLIAYTFGTLLGVISATSNVRWLSFFGKRSSTILDTPPILTALFFSAVPALIFVPTLIWLLVIKMPLLPASGWDGLFSLSAVIPIIALSVPGIAGIALLVRTSCLLVVEQPYVVTARAKGVRRGRILVSHVLRNSLMPLTTQVTASLAGLITGSLFVELQYGIPGMARLMLDAVGARDFSIYVPMTMMIVVLFIIGVRMADILYTFIDPRVAFMDE